MVTASGINVWCTYDEIVEVSKLKPNPKNPNRHFENQIERLANIIKNNGWRQPVKVSNQSGFIVSGHGRYEAALFLGVDHVPVDYQDYESTEQELADLLADNKLAELSNMDNKMLAGIFNELKGEDFDISQSGYDDIEVEAALIMAVEHEEDIDDFFTETEQKEKESKQTICPHCGMPIDA